MTEAQSAIVRKSKASSAFFAVLILLLCGWVFSMPVFPSQDGPMHKYYVHALSQMIHGSVLYNASYQVRHPLPPYITHYALLLGFSRFLSLDHAESLIVCLILISTAYSFRYCARALGSSGDGVSLCALALLLNWNLFMGFLNYEIGIALFFLSAGIWCRFHTASWQLRVGFLGSLIMMMMTHPVPLLLLIAFLFLDFTIQVTQFLRNAHLQVDHQLSFVPEFRWHFLAILCACVCFSYPILISNKSHVASNLTNFGLHTKVLVASLGLYGLSPFNPSSKDLVTNVYRLGLVSLLALSFALASRGIFQRMRASTLSRSDTFLFGSAFLAIALPILPTNMNDAAFFSQRLMIFIWLFALAALAGFSDEARGLSRGAPLLAASMVLITLINLQRFVAPVSRDLANIESQYLSSSLKGLVLSGPSLFSEEKWVHNLGFSPYSWCGVLPLIHSDGVMLNSTFLDMTTMPLAGSPTSDQAISHLDVHSTYLLNANMSINILPPPLQLSLLRASDFLIIVGPVQDLRFGLEPFIGRGSASSYNCETYSFYSVCRRKD